MDLNYEEICCWPGTLAPETLTLCILALLAKLAFKLTLTGSIGWTCGLFKLLPIRFLFLFSVTRLDSSFLLYWMVYCWAPRRGLMPAPMFAL